MADYTDLPNTAVGKGGIPSGTTVTALRDNPIAMAEGAAGAPRVEDAALDTGAATAAGITWVGLRTAGRAVGAVGTYALLRFIVVSGSSQSPGATVAGSLLRYANAAGDATPTSPAGTWRVMGWSDDGGGESARTTVFLRIS